MNRDRQTYGRLGAVVHDRLGMPVPISFTSLAASGAIAGLLIVSGWAIPAGHLKVLVIVFAAVILGWVAITQRGVFVGIMLLAAMNGIPYVDTSKFVTSKLTLEDVAIIVLICTALLWRQLDPAPRTVSRAARVVSAMGSCLLLWWVFTMAHTVTTPNVSLIHSVSYGREYLFFASLLLVLPRVRFTPHDIWALLAVLVVGVCLFAVGQIMTATGHGTPGGLIHFEHTLAQSGLTRVYAEMTDLVGACLAVGLSACYISRQRNVKRIAYPVTLLLLIGLIVQLTRARWIGLVVGVVVVSLWLAVRAETHLAATVRRRLSVSIWGLGFAILATAVALPTVFSGTVIQRLLSTFTDLESGGGTFAVRTTVSSAMTGTLGSKWPLGIGFVPPSAHYFVGLPSGSIKDADLGVLNAVMTMGVIGALLVYLPAVFALIYCSRKLSAELSFQYIWLRYGCAVWIVGALVSSGTLVTLFSPSGLALTAVVITLLVHPSVSGVPLPNTSVIDGDREVAPSEGSRFNLTQPGWTGALS